MPRGVKKEQPKVVRYLVQSGGFRVYWTNIPGPFTTVLAYGYEDGNVTWRE